ncbi:MAG: hypothetical protein OXH60_02875 [Rhodospirillales bacterium]|nr:hypothetical protein [Rhodospirillales bacterium]
MKKFKYRDHIFEVSEPKDCRITVAGYGKSAEIRIEDKSGKVVYTPNFDGRDGFSSRSLEATVGMAAYLIVESLDKTSKDDLRREMEAFYKDLPVG